MQPVALSHGDDGISGCFLGEEHEDLVGDSLDMLQHESSVYVNEFGHMLHHFTEHIDALEVLSNASDSIPPKPLFPKSTAGLAYSPRFQGTHSPRQ